jgi:hypothetical protein
MSSWHRRFQPNSPIFRTERQKLSQR